MQVNKSSKHNIQWEDNRMLSFAKQNRRSPSGPGAELTLILRIILDMMPGLITMSQIPGEESDTRMGKVGRMPSSLVYDLV